MHCSTPQRTSEHMWTDLSLHLVASLVQVYSLIILLLCLLVKTYICHVVLSRTNTASLQQSENIFGGLVRERVWGTSSQEVAPSNKHNVEASETRCFTFLI